MVLGLVGAFPVIVCVAGVTQPTLDIENKQVRSRRYLLVEVGADRAVGIMQQRNRRHGRLFPEVLDVLKFVVPVRAYGPEIDTILILVDRLSQGLIIFGIGAVLLISRSFEQNKRERRWPIGLFQRGERQLLALTIRQLQIAR